MPMLAILGLSSPVEQDWDTIRAIQLSGVERHSLIRTVINLVLGLMVCQTLSNVIETWIIALWFGALIAAVIYPANLAQKIGHNVKGDAVRREITKLAGSMAALAAVWSIPLLLVPASHPDVLATVWMVLAALVIALVVLLHAAPMGTLAFNVIAMGASIFAFSKTGELTTIGAVASFSILSFMATIESARAWLLLKMNEVGLAEKNEVVSMLLREFEEGGADWLWQIDSARRIVHASPRFSYAVGMDAKAMEGQPLVQIISGQAWESGDFPPSLHRLAEKLKRRESFSNLMVRVSVNDETRWWELSASPRFDGNNTFVGFRGVGSDVTEKRKSDEKISHMARFDNLTGLPNRLQLTEGLSNALADAAKWRGRCGFMMIDLDRFKSVNDTLGHLVGDRLLAMVSQRLRTLMSKNELCGRLGGDEFAVIVHDASDAARFNMLAKEIIDTLSRPYEVGENTLFIGASVGTALGPSDGDTVETLMRSADLALYRSKDDGGGRHNCYEPRLHSTAEERRVMEMALRKALERDEFSLAFQPVVGVDSEAIMGFEALLRWNSQDFGPVSPAKFIPLAEEARLVVPIGNWVLHRACREATMWPSNIKVAVNVSAEQLYEADFVETVVEALSETGLEPARLELEVTESVFLREGSDVCETLDRILSLGVGLALDDFGTGYSALGYLSKTRFTTIKVDRSFVQGAAKGLPESIAIIRAVVAMADSLGMSTTAEGAETDHEVAIIRGLGCKKIQGYFYGRPMAGNDVLELFGSFGQAQIA